MKNIHILPTENESRLRYNSFNKVYELCEFPKYHTDIKSTHNIYITSDEEIKEGDWILNETHNIEKAISHYNYKSLSSDCKKIILTTDVDLIKYGVQDIDDEFLEWFVKNTSCEEVRVVDARYDISTLTNDVKKYPNLDVPDYKIIIPKKEDMNMNEEFEKSVNIIDDWLEKNGDPEIAKQVEQEAKELCEQETLEEAAEKYDSQYVNRLRPAFIAGAKWQQERMYSEEEVLDLLCAKNIELNLYEGRDKVEQWFEQFKK